jgi:hypothetical protein
VLDPPMPILLTSIPVHTVDMSRSITDQMVDKGLVQDDETPEAKRAAERAAQPAEPEKAFPPAFEAPARGVIVTSSGAGPRVARRCVSCGGTLPYSPRADQRCAECAAEGD